MEAHQTRIRQQVDDLRQQLAEIRRERAGLDPNHPNQTLLLQDQTLLLQAMIGKQETLNILLRQGLQPLLSSSGKI
jgi:hypothetical protein